MLNNSQKYNNGLGNLLNILKTFNCFFQISYHHLVLHLAITGAKQLVSYILSISDHPLMISCKDGGRGQGFYYTRTSCIQLGGMTEEENGVKKVKMYLKSSMNDPCNQFLQHYILQNQLNCPLIQKGSNTQFSY